MFSGIQYKHAYFLHTLSKIQPSYPDEIPYTPEMTPDFRRSIKKIDRAFLDMFGSLPAPDEDIWTEREIRAVHDLGSEAEADDNSSEDGDNEVDPVLERTFNSLGFSSSRGSLLDALVEPLPLRSSRTPPSVFLSRQPTLGRGSANVPFAVPQPPETPAPPKRIILQAKRQHERAPLPSSLVQEMPVRLHATPFVSPEPTNKRRKNAREFS